MHFVIVQSQAEETILRDGQKAQQMQYLKQQTAEQRAAREAEYQRSRGAVSSEYFAYFGSSHR